MKRALPIAALFLLLTIFMTYPLAFRMGSYVRDVGDPLLNTWILSWDIDHISRFDFRGFFNANIFYPQPRTLAYSEFLIPQALVALPVKLLSGNPVLAHNFVMLLAFLTTGLGMFFLARHLTGSARGAVLAGIVFAFSPFMFSHLYQVQILTAGGIPLAFLFLHKFFEKDRFRDLLLFGLFFVLQALANGYYALYLTIFAGVFVAVFAVVRKKYREPRFWARCAAVAVLIALGLFPFYRQYYAVQKEMGFTRDIASEARPVSFFSVPKFNDIYGGSLGRFSKSERDLFPGLAAFVLACLGAAFALRFRRREAGVGTEGEPSGSSRVKRPKRPLTILLWLLVIGALFYAGLLYYLLGWAGVEVKLGPLGTFHAHNLTKLMVTFVVLVVAAVILRRALGKRLLPLSPDWDTPWIYIVIGLLAFALSFGSKGPYQLLHRYVPGFTGLRSASRFHVLVMFALAVLVAYGIAGLGHRLRPGKLRGVALAALPLLVLVEYLSLPVPLVRVPVKKEIPAVYRWLAEQNRPLAVVELPLPRPKANQFEVECPRVYFSAYHRQNMVNGYSGFFPPLYRELLVRYETLPVYFVVDDLNEIGVRYLIVHVDELKKAKLHPVMERLLTMKDRVREVRQFGRDVVFEIIGGETSPEAALAASPHPLLSRAGWKATAGPMPDKAGLAIDGKLETRWDTGAVQKKGQWYTLDLGRSAVAQGLTLKLDDSPSDYPRGLRVEVSPDGATWRTAVDTDDVRVPLISLVRPGAAEVNLAFPPTECRFIRLVETGSDREFYWSIHELEVWGKDTTPATRR